MMSDTAKNAVGRWLGILTNFGIEPRYLQNRHGPCPLCGGTDRFRFDDKDGSGSFFCTHCGAGDGLKLLMYWKGWDFKTAAREVDLIIGTIEVKQWRKAVSPIGRLRRIAAELKPVSGTVVEKYLASRGIDSAAPSIKFHPCLAYYDNATGEKTGEFSAMVALVLDKNMKPCTYHVTYLNESGGKANVCSPKKMMPGLCSFIGGGIWLGEKADKIVIAEGIETALSGQEICGIPGVAAVSDAGMKAFDPPDHVKSVFILADNDVSYAGQAAAFALAKRLKHKGLEVAVQVPHIPGSDYNDVLVCGGS